MAVEYKKLFISKKLAQDTDDRDEYTPSNGAKVSLEWINGTSGPDPDTAVCLVWDEAGLNTVEWCTEGDLVSSHTDRALPDGDGVKKLALVIDNSAVGDHFVTGECLIKVVT